MAIELARDKGISRTGISTASATDLSFRVLLGHPTHLFLHSALIRQATVKWLEPESREIPVAFGIFRSFNKHKNMTDTPTGFPLARERRKDSGKDVWQRRKNDQETRDDERASGITVSRAGLTTYQVPCPVNASSSLNGVSSNQTFNRLGLSPKPNRTLSP